MTEYHVILTVQWPGMGGGQAITLSGTANPDPGTTRRDLFNELVEKMHERGGRNIETDRAKMNVLFYSCEPNELT